MFFVRELTGQNVPYSPGALRNRRTVSAITAIQPYSGGDPYTPEGESTSEADTGPQENPTGEMATAIDAYSRIMNPEEPRRRVVFAHEMMSKDVVSLRSDAPLLQAHQLFTTRRFRHIPIVDAKKELVGMLSDRDLLRHNAHLTESSAANQAAWHSAPTSSIMHQPVLFAEGDTEIREIARVMFEERIGCVPIVDNNQTIIGIITRSDILRTLLVQSPLELWR